MGMLINGKWTPSSIIRSDTKGRYDRLPRTFRHAITNDGVFTPLANRYHLYVSYACPWATRTLIYLSLKGLEGIINVSVVHPDMLENGWTFLTTFKDTSGDTLYHYNYLYQLYQKADNNITTSVTVPVLWDTHTQTIVNNESSDIIRIFNTAFNDITGNIYDYYPISLRDEINHWNTLIYDAVNNGVYQCGFATSQDAYDEAVDKLFNQLDTLDKHLSTQDFLVGNTLTEADIRLLPTLLRFDLVYYVHFKTNVRRIADYSHLSRYMHNLLSMDAVMKHYKPDHIKRHYYYSHAMINPYRIVPKGPL